jgi:WD40 repeat protein
MRLGETDSGSRDQVDPENPVASERFFQELIVHREKALPLPIASFAH